MNFLFGKDISPVRKLLMMKAAAMGYELVTETGNPVTFTTDLAKPPKSLIITLEPVQAGSGDPSPTNPRSISGRSSVVLKVSGADTSDPTEHTASIPTPPGTLYGGEIDWVRQKLKVTHAMVDMGEMTWTKGTSSHDVTYFYSYINEMVKGVVGTDLLLCEVYKPIPCINTNVATTSTFPDLTICQSSGGASVRIRDDSYSDGTTLQTAVTGKYLVYPLDTPIEYDLSSLAEITLAMGENNLWIEDSGNIEIKFLKKG